MESRRDVRSIEALMAAKEIVIFAGSGGVGKTTTAAAAAALAAARHGGRVLVLTVDPARRLASALGLGGLGNTETLVPLSGLEASGMSPRGQMWAAMLDTKASWDDLVRRHAPDRGTEERILENPLYQNIAGRFVQSHDYIAMERLYELHASGSWDLIVVDTPPTRNAVDFIEAPQRMAEFFSSRLLRLLIVPYRSRMVNLASRPFYQIADRILGSQFLADIAEFFLLFQSMYEGFVERAGAVTRLLADRRTTFLVVSTLEPAPVREAEYFARALVARRLHLGAVVANKVLPSYFRDREAARIATQMSEHSQELADGPAGEGLDPELVSGVLREIAGSFLNFGVVARREGEQMAELATRPEVVATVPFFDGDVVDLEGLLRVGNAMWS